MFQADLPDCPAMSMAELIAFHRSHFEHGTTHIRAEFDDGVTKDYEEEDDGLGYYDDGVKRTLTDEQIAIFRHSELEQLRKDAEKKERQNTKHSKITSKPLRNSSSPEPEVVNLAIDEVDEGEIEEHVASRDQQRASAVPDARRGIGLGSKRRKKGGRAGHNGHGSYTPKPDLRKRTWDVVETGLGSLGYDDNDTSGVRTTRSTQRRRIAYDDD